MELKSLPTVHNGGTFSTSGETHSEWDVGEPKEEACSVFPSLKGQLDSFTLHQLGVGWDLIGFPFHEHLKYKHLLILRGLYSLPAFLNHCRR